MKTKISAHLLASNTLRTPTYKEQSLRCRSPQRKAFMEKDIKAALKLCKAVTKSLKGLDEKNV
jgi:hypothetical protein